MSSPQSSSSSSQGRHRVSPSLRSALVKEEIEDVLESEVFVDVNKLRKCARQGIPEELRG
ncbi:hypothetical protein COEREDRAFT_5876, partial [Coemansia reversa NRRL 1564]